MRLVVERAGPPALSDVSYLFSVLLSVSLLLSLLLSLSVCFSVASMVSGNKSFLFDLCRCLQKGLCYVS